MFNDPNLRYLGKLSQIDLRNLGDTKRGDLEIGLSSWQQAYAVCAALNMLPIPERYMMEMFYYFQKYGVIRIPGPALRLIQEDLRSYFPRGAPCIKDLIPEFTDHDDLVSKIISPSGKAQVVEQLLGEASISHSFDHALALNDLREASLRNENKIYQHVITGSFSKVLHSLRSNKKSGLRPDVLRNTVRNHARYLAVLVAHHQTGIVRAHSRQPWGSAFSGENEWKYVGHTLTSGIVSPALILQKLARILEAGAVNGMTDDQIVAYLIKEGILSDDAKQTGDKPKFGMATWQICRNAFDKLPPEQRTPDADFTQKVLRLADSAKPLSQLRRGHMRLAGFTAKTFSELRLQVSPSEATASIARNLLEEFASIDRILFQPGELQPKSRITFRDYGLKQLYFMTTLLRAETIPDKHAAMIGVERTADGGINSTNNSSAGPVHSMLEKIQDPLIFQNLQSCLGFEVAHWFNRYPATFPFQVPPMSIAT